MGTINKVDVEVSVHGCLALIEWAERPLSVLCDPITLGKATTCKYLEALSIRPETNKTESDGPEQI